MDLNGQFVSGRHNNDLGRSLRRINPRKEWQEISQGLARARLRAQVRVFAGHKRRDCGDLNGAGVEDLLLAERSYQLGRQG
jgi:hypothetical protein